MSVTANEHIFFLGATVVGVFGKIENIFNIGLGVTCFVSF